MAGFAQTLSQLLGPPADGGMSIYRPAQKMREAMVGKGRRGKFEFGDLLEMGMDPILLASIMTAGGAKALAKVGGSWVNRGLAKGTGTLGQQELVDVLSRVPGQIGEKTGERVLQPKWLAQDALENQGQGSLGRLYETGVSTPEELARRAGTIPLANTEIGPATQLTTRAPKSADLFPGAAIPGLMNLDQTLSPTTRGAMNALEGAGAITTHPFTKQGGRDLARTYGGVPSYLHVTPPDAPGGRAPTLLDLMDPQSQAAMAEMRAEAERRAAVEAGRPAYGGQGPRELTGSLEQQFGGDVNPQRFQYPMTSAANEVRGDVVLGGSAAPGASLVEKNRSIALANTTPAEDAARISAGFGEKYSVAKPRIEEAIDKLENASPKDLEAWIDEQVGLESGLEATSRKKSVGLVNILKLSQENASKFADDPQSMLSSVKVGNAVAPEKRLETALGGTGIEKVKEKPKVTATNITGPKKLPTTGTAVKNAQSWTWQKTREAASKSPKPVTKGRVRKLTRGKGSASYSEWKAMTPDERAAYTAAGGKGRAGGSLAIALEGVPEEQAEKIREVYRQTQLKSEQAVDETSLGASLSSFAGTGPGGASRAGSQEVVDTGRLAESWKRADQTRRDMGISSGKRSPKKYRNKGGEWLPSWGEIDRTAPLEARIGIAKIREIANGLPDKGDFMRAVELARKGADSTPDMQAAIKHIDAVIEAKGVKRVANERVKDSFLFRRFEFLKEASHEEQVAALDLLKKTNPKGASMLGGMLSDRKIVRPKVLDPLVRGTDANGLPFWESPSQSQTTSFRGLLEKVDWGSLNKAQLTKLVMENRTGLADALRLAIPKMERRAGEIVARDEASVRRILGQLLSEKGYSGTRKGELVTLLSQELLHSPNVGVRENIKIPKLVAALGPMSMANRNLRGRDERR